MAFAGQVTRLKLEVKNGSSVDGRIDPLNPEAPVHPEGTLIPSVVRGHETASHVDVKNGEVILTVVVPLYPAKQLHPWTMSSPVLFAGHRTAVHMLRYVCELS